MGVILNETITLPNGLTVTNPYASVGDHHIRVEKEERINAINEPATTKYVLECRFSMWASQELRVSGSREIGGLHVSIESDTPLTGNVYDLLYNKLKTMKTCTDLI
jgi:hypothetical protein